ncbi:MAG: hypothetical protein C4305_00325 [Thermoleophilia bacterium]
MLAVAFIAQAAGLDTLRDVTSRLDPSWLAVCAGGQLLGLVGYVLALRNVARLENGPVIGFRSSARTVVAGFGVYHASHPSGGFGVDYLALRRAGLDREGAIARVACLGALEWAVLAPAAFASALAVLAGSGQVQAAMTWPWLAVVPGFALALWVSSPKRSARLADPSKGGRLRAAVVHAVAGVVMLRALAARPVQHLPGLVGVCLYYLGDIACLWAALKTFSVEVSTPALVLAYATGYAASRRSLPAGGAGVVEALMTFALVWVGLPLAPALAGVVFYRLFNFWLAMLPALVVVPSMSRLRLEVFRRAQRQAA